MESAPPHIDAVLGDLIRTSHTLEPDQLPEAVHRALGRLDVVDTVIYLVDYEQEELHHLVRPGATAAPPLSVDTTATGHVFRTLTPAEVGGSPGRVLLPLLDGSHRIGVLDVSPPADNRVTIAQWMVIAGLVADLVVAKSVYGDTTTMTRRSRPKALRAEAQGSLLPPLTLITPRMLITGMLVPSYEVAGDIFDYALNGDTLHIAILDAMGHSLDATLIASVAAAAYRNNRRQGGSLEDGWRLADEAVAVSFQGERFATAILGELDLVDGTLRSLSAGHPPALVARDNRVVARCANEPTLPLGLRGDPPVVTTTQLQPGDRVLLFTDGIVEARSASGEFFGEERLVEQVSRELGTGLPAPEAVRRLVRTVAKHQSGKLRDDATLLLVEWRGADPEDLPPHT